MALADGKLMAPGKAHRSWLIQRITAVLLIPLALWFVWSIVSMLPLNYQTTHNWLAQPVNSVLFGSFLLILFHHTWLGLKEVTEDYVHNTVLKSFSLFLLITILLALLALSLHSLFSLRL